MDKKIKNHVLFQMILYLNPKCVCYSPGEKLKEINFVSTVKHSDKKCSKNAFFVYGLGAIVPVEA